MPERFLPIPDGLDQLRVDTAVARLLGLSRTRASAIVDAGGVRRAGRSLRRSDCVEAGEMLEVSWEDPADASPPVVPAEFAIVHDELDFVVVDKPAGVAAHPSVGWDGPTVTGALAQAGLRISTSGVAERQGVVQRLDVGTSGLMVVAKSERAYTSLKRQFHDREVSKEYHALVRGHPDPSVGTIDAPIGRHPRHEWKFAVTAHGKSAITHYETVEAFVFASLLSVRLETGRTHQIRVHFAAQHHPCIGDPLYGADPRLSARVGLDRQWLHAVGLGFLHPGSGEWVRFRSAYSPDLQRALDVVRGHPAT